MQQIENLLYKIYRNFDDWAAHMGLINRDTIQLKVHKVERNSDYETIFPPPPVWVLGWMINARRAVIFDGNAAER